jgi:hypothetical protein|tara:strand:- start:45 stop:218 length:174 start_codon:yes stop_codon:yes gene_type:complete
MDVIQIKNCKELWEKILGITNLKAQTKEKFINLKEQVFQKEIRTSLQIIKRLILEIK